MYKLSLTVLIVATLKTTAWGQAQSTPCGQPWQTLNPDGTADTFAIAGLTCIPQRGSTTGNCGTLAAATAKSPNMACQFLTSKMGYRCCFQKIQATYPTPAPGATLASVAPGVTQTPQNLKPKCPVGALASVTAGSNEVKQCNATNTVNQACPSGYTCTKATNINDVYGTLTIATDDFGAVRTPYVCCRSDTLNSKTAAWKDIPVLPESLYPTGAIVSVKLTADEYAYFNDDFSGLTDQLVPFTTEINLDQTTVAAKFYHVFFYDSTTNKECIFIANSAGSDSTKLEVGELSATTGAMVYNAGPATAPVFKWSATYGADNTAANILGKFNTVRKRWVMLVWVTDAELTFAATGVRSTTLLNILSEASGDFQPTSSTPAGLYVNATTTLINRIYPILGKPIAGTYFYAMK